MKSQRGGVPAVWEFRALGFPWVAGTSMPVCGALAAPVVPPTLPGSTPARYRLMYRETAVYEFEFDADAPPTDWMAAVSSLGVMIASPRSVGATARMHVESRALVEMGPAVPGEPMALDRMARTK